MLQIIKNNNKRKTEVRKICKTNRMLSKTFGQEHLAKKKNHTLGSKREDQ